MTIGELKQYLATCGLSDEAPVYIESKHGFHTARAEAMCCDEENQYGQTSSDYQGGDDNALVLIDTSRG